MCCVNIDAIVILANLGASKNYKRRSPITKEIIYEYCKYLNILLDGYKFFYTSEKSLNRVVQKLPNIFKWENGSVICLDISEKQLNIINEIFDDSSVVKNLKYAANIILEKFN